MSPLRSTPNRSLLFFYHVLSPPTRLISTQARVFCHMQIIHGSAYPNLALLSPSYWILTNTSEGLHVAQLHRLGCNSHPARRCIRQPSHQLYFWQLPQGLVSSTGLVITHLEDHVAWDIRHCWLGKSTLIVKNNGIQPEAKQHA